MTRAAFLATIFLALSVSGAYAVSPEVENACRDDYYTYCSRHEVGSKALRSCMRAARDKLTPRCARALAKSGEATSDDIRRYKARKRR